MKIWKQRKETALLNGICFIITKVNYFLEEIGNYRIAIKNA